MKLNADDKVGDDLVSVIVCDANHGDVVAADVNVENR